MCFFRTHSTDGSWISWRRPSDFGHVEIRPPQLAAEVSAHRIDPALRCQGRSSDGGGRSKENHLEKKVEMKMVLLKIKGVGFFPKI